MATIAEMFVNIGADVTGFEREVESMQRQFSRLANRMQGDTRPIARGMQGLSAEAQQMQREITDSFNRQRASMKDMREDQIKVQHGWMKLTESAKEYSGTNAQFMAEVAAMGKQQKKLADQAMKNNEMMKNSFLQGVGAMLARSGQASKIAANFERMNNPLYNVNRGLLNITESLDGIARSGQPAVLALRQLGPTASMYELNNQVMLINQGLMRWQGVALIALGANLLMFSALHKAAMETNAAYKTAFEGMGSSIGNMFKPMVELFAQIMTPVYNFITSIANMVNKFNEAHPLLAKIIAGFLMLVVVLALVLSPLAIGIGLFGGLQAAFAALWLLIGPVVIGFASFMGTVILVAAAIALLVGGIVYLWKTNDTFRNAIIAAWNQIKAVAFAVWGAIVAFMKPIIADLVAFFNIQLAKLKSIWVKHGSTIMQIVKIAWAAIAGVIKVAMSVITTVIKVAWELIKMVIKVVISAIKVVISTVLNIIVGIISAFLSLIKGDWRGAWETIKSTVVNIFNGIWQFIKGLGKTFYQAGRGLIEQIINGIKSMAGAVIGAVKNVAGKIRDFLPFSPAKEGPLSDLDKLDFGGPIQDSLFRGMPQIKRTMSKLLTMPSFEANQTITSAAIVNPNNANGGNGGEYTINVYPQIDGQTMARATVKYNQAELDKREVQKNRFSGVLSYGG